MDTTSAFIMGEMNRGKPAMVFDWNKAAMLIKEKQPAIVSAGLQSDWEWTGGEIFSNGKPDIDAFCYLCSTWATPEIEIDGEIFECFIMQDKSDGWDAKTVWPESALSILNE